MKNLCGEEVEYLVLQGPYETVLEIEEISPSTVEINFTVEGKMDYSGSHRVARTRWLLKTFQQFQAVNPGVAFITECYSQDQMGSVRQKAYKKLGFREYGRGYLKLYPRPLQQPTDVPTKNWWDFLFIKIF